MEPGPDLRERLAQLPHFRDLAPELLARVAALTRRVEVAVGHVLFHEGQHCDAFYFVEAGRMKIYRLAPDGRERVVHHIGPGQSFAEAALFQFGSFPASAAPVDGPATLLRVDGARFLKLLADEHSLGTSMIGSLCGWLHVLLDRIEVLTLVSAGSRLAAFLLRLPARDVGGELLIELPMPKKDLASELSITPETLSRLLARWRDRKLIRVDGRRVALLDPRTLEALAESSSAE